MSNSRNLANIADESPTLSTVAAVYAGGALSGRNRIINGDMRIDQRNAGVSITLSGTGQYIVDRMKCRLDASSSSTGQQVSDAPVGFNNSIKVTIGTGAAPSSSQLGWVNQAIEGYNIADLGWGTANAKTVTVSFWVKSSVTGIFSGAVKNASTSAYVFQYTVSSANTWEQKSVTIAGDTANTWVTDNGFGLAVIFDLGTGTTYQTAAGAWANGNYFSATGSTALCATSGATFYITGVQLEEGAVATPFEHRQYGQELALCQRYCYVGDLIVSGNCDSGGNPNVAVQLPVTPRTTPTMSSYSGSWRGALLASVTNLSVVNLNANAVGLYSTQTGTANTVVVGYGGKMSFNFSMEL